MSAENPAQTAAAPATRRKMPPEFSILLVLLGITLAFEALGWIFVGQSFLGNWQRLQIIILQMSVVGIIAVGVTQVIITGGIDLSSGSIVGVTVMVAASFAQSSEATHLIYPWAADLPFLVPLLVGLGVGLIGGMINGGLISYTGIPPFIATLGMYVSARGAAKWYTKGQPISTFTPNFDILGGTLDIGPVSLPVPVLIFLAVALIFQIALSYTRYGKFTYAIGANRQAARVSGINIQKHLLLIYSIAGLLAGLAGVVAAARQDSGQAGMGVGYELDAIAATVIGGTSLSGGVGRITGTVIGIVILGVVTSGFTFLGIDAYFQEIVKGAIIILAVIADQYRQGKRGKA